MQQNAILSSLPATRPTESVSSTTAWIEIDSTHPVQPKDLERSWLRFSHTSTQSDDSRQRRTPRDLSVPSGFSKSGITSLITWSWRENLVPMGTLRLKRRSASSHQPSVRQSHSSATSPTKTTQPGCDLPTALCSHLDLKALGCQSSRLWPLMFRWWRATLRLCRK